MKKCLGRVLLLGLMIVTHVKAMPVIDASNLAVNTITATSSTTTAANTGVVAANTPIQTVSSKLTSLSTFYTEVKTTLMEAWDKSVWVQQLKGLWDSLIELKKNVNEVMGLRDDVMNTFSGFRNTGISDYTSKGNESVAYDYAMQLPDAYVGTVSCSDSDSCSVSGAGYKGVARSGETSKNIRDAWKVSSSASLTAVDINQLTYSEGERHAQAIAVIQAMAREAYTQANNRIAKIEELQSKIDGMTNAVNTKSVIGSEARSGWTVTTNSVDLSHSATAGTSSASTGATSASSISGSTPTFKSIGENQVISSDTAATASNGNPASTDGNKNDLKYIADLQARIQTEQALLINDQNKLTSLAILQKSEDDAHEQRKRELAAYVVDAKGRDDVMASLGKVGIAAAQKASYELIAGWYK